MTVTTRRAELDGIRAFAVLVVIAFHSDISLFQGGYLGVDVFFVLSGYLITSILLNEHERSGTIALRVFYVRRLLRLYPALLVLLVLTLVTMPLTVAQNFYRQYAIAALAAATYTINFVSTFHGTDTFLGHAWSLASEEQFYLVWPPVLLFCMVRRRASYRSLARGTALAAIVCLVVLVACYRPTSGTNMPGTYFSPIGRAGGLLVGCALAFVIASRGPWPFKHAAGIATSIGILMLAMVPLVPKASAGPEFLAAIPVVWVLTAALIYLVAAASPRCLSWRPIAWLGRISYGLYLYHVLVYKVVSSQISSDRRYVFLIATAATIAVAAASYYVVEQPFLRLKDRIGDRGHTPSQTSQGDSSSGLQHRAKFGFRTIDAGSPARPIRPIE
jgi:peptidoglycan/LPS O-acetylase OafA/YrhL